MVVEAIQATLGDSAKTLDEMLTAYGLVAATDSRHASQSK